jgi:hypothetical protein
MNSYFYPGEKCQKCRDAEAKHRFPYGWLAIKGGSRYRVQWHLCPQCLANAKQKTTGKQQPLFYYGEGGKLIDSGKTIWPDAVEGRTYGHHLEYPHG